MKITLNETTYYVQITGHGQPTWLLLHGFMGSHHDFDQIRPQLPGTVISPDLLGHGQTVAPQNKVFSMAQQIKDLLALCNHLVSQPPLYLVGYSMGGRVALGLTVRQPQMIDHLFLESTRPGLQQPSQRLARVQHDAQLAKALTTQGLSTFVARWAQLPLFQSQQSLPIASRNRIKQQRLQQEPQQLAKSLQHMGTGRQPNYWPELDTLQMPITLITGALDTKFTQINQAMAQKLSNSHLICLPQVGHNTHVEAPERFGQILTAEVGV